ncbi:Sporulation lipoprotein YhcN/YlaJ (Spore_YhcN_YlaJ) [Salinibacillus kushneri]|uniref:Sporulation lipoprotein YhcN/YlaJ (Spore_YhcN_YlaJ) n=1 Tax=Salinibacillus kushneri TaxID=237682 RepID=A0A1I0G935_9BACI|nr:YhcN/YlaJ family sporulation lipoprotein [Salinibacillus kushneri]SET67524.1 Sporulation lipoprotein YhcN/YlaJ (Spore_YhcN_YlaJ) [Salinibacillus kushneri]
MKRVLFLIILTSVMFLVACGGNEDEAQNHNNNMNTQPVKYRENNTTQQNDTNREENVREYTNIEAPNQNLEEADNELSRRLKEEILKVEGVNQAEVVVNDDRLVVALDIVNRQRANPVIPNRVRDVIEKFEMDDKNVSIYTDEAYFNRVRNMLTRP